MPNYSSNRLQTAYAQLQGVGNLRAINQSAGTWNNANTKKLRYTTFRATPENPVVDVNYKTGNSSQPIGIRGRSRATWSLELPIIPSGTAGTAPDQDPLFQHIFGQAATVVASTSVTYNLADAVNPLAIFTYDKSGLSPATHQYVVGGCAQTARFTLNAAFLMMSLDGMAVYAPDSATFSSYIGPDAVVKGGLTTYPAEPTGLSNIGSPITGFGGTVTIDGNSMGDLHGSAVIELSSGIEFAEDGILDAYPFASIRGLRRVTFASFQFLNDDTTALTNLKQKSYNKLPVNVSIALNAAGAGNIVTFNLNNVQLGQFGFADNGTFVDVVMGGNSAHASSTSVTDDFTIAFT